MISKVVRRLIAYLILVMVAPSMTGCETKTQPAYVRIVVLTGTPYERGFNHGRMFSSEIRSLYTMLLSTSIMPFLNRELPTIEEYLWSYQEDKYQNGQFAYLLFLESGQNLFGFQNFMEKLVCDRGLVDYFLDRMQERYLLNLDRLARIDTEGGEPKAVVLNDGTRLPLSRSGYQRIKKRL